MAGGTASRSPRFRPCSCNGERVSSTAIRHALKAGDLATARAMLGRDYSISGRVVRGLGLGRKLGFPTANVHLKRIQAPIDGIFAARVTGLDERRSTASRASARARRSAAAWRCSKC